MIEQYLLSICKNEKPIDFKYIEMHYPQTDTEISLYDTYKLNIMLSDGLAAVLNERNDIYSTFSGDLLFFGPQEIHHGRILRQGIHRYIEVLIPTEYFPNNREFHALFNDASEARTNLISPAPKERTDILHIARRMIESLHQPSSGTDVALLQDLTVLISLCCQLYASKEKGNQKIPAALERSIKLIQKKHAESIRLSDLASASNCSTSYLSRIFKKHVGKSPYEYLTEYRLFMAEKLLRGANSVTEAAMLSGFSDTSVFIKCFKKAFGITPLQYQKSNRT